MSNLIPVLQRSLALLDYLSDYPEGKTLAELTAALGIPKTTLFRILKTFEAAQYVTMDPATGRYALSSGCLRIGLAVLENTSVEKVARPVMADIVHQCDITCKLSIPQPKGVMCIAKEDVREGIGIVAKTGTVFPYHAGAAGKLLLAYQDPEFIRRYLADTALEPLTRHTITEKAELMKELDEIRRRGYAVDCGEYRVGVGAVAFPIRNYSGDIVAALSGVFLLEQAKPEDIMPHIERGAAAISARLGKTLHYHQTPALSAARP